MRNGAPAMLVAIASFAASLPVAAENPRILADSANIRVLDGSTLHNPCDIANVPDADRGEIRPPGSECVLAPADRATELQNAYVRELRRAGWDFEGGAGITFWFERPAQQEGCRQALDMTGFPRDLEDNSAGVVFFFALRPEPVCRSAAR